MTFLYGVPWWAQDRGNDAWGCMSGQAFLGEVATWTGIVTGTLMFASPALFARWKWRGVAGATPAFMLWTGLPFFVGCVLYNVAHPGPSLVGTAALRALVMVGAVLQVRSALLALSVFILACLQFLLFWMVHTLEG